MDTQDGPIQEADTDAAGGGDGVDPVTVEIVKGALRSAQGEMEMLLERTAMSPIIREKQDYFCGIFDRHARLLIGTKIPVLGNILRPILETYAVDDMKPGDLYWYNDCYGSKGGVSHSPDQVFVAPVFVDGELVAYAHSWAHFLDVGGMRAGSTTPDATEIFQEGIIVPPVRLYREGRAERGAAPRLHAQFPFPGHGAGRCPRFGRGRAAGRAPHRGAVRALRRRRASGRFRYADRADRGGGPERVPRDLRHRAIPLRRPPRHPTDMARGRSRFASACRATRTASPSTPPRATTRCAGRSTS